MRPLLANNNIINDPKIQDCRGVESAWRVYEAPSTEPRVAWQLKATTTPRKKSWTESSIGIINLVASSMFVADVSACSPPACNGYRVLASSLKRTPGSRRNFLVDRVATTGIFQSTRRTTFSFAASTDSILNLHGSPPLSGRAVAAMCRRNLQFIRGIRGHLVDGISTPAIMRSLFALRREGSMARWIFSCIAVRMEFVRQLWIINW